MTEEPQLELDDHYPQDRKQYNRDEKLMLQISSSSTNSVDPGPACCYKLLPRKIMISLQELDL